MNSSSHHDRDTPLLKPGALFAERALRDKARLKAYNQLLEQIYNRIKVASRVPGNAWILYTVPPFVFGLPKIDLEDCVVYLVHQLRQADYEVRYTYPNLLFISWRHHERNYILKDSPIMKAMLPTPPTPVPALKSAMPGGGKRGGLRSDGGGGSHAQQQGQQGNQSQQAIVVQQPFVSPIRAAGEYTPPNSFLNAMSGGLGENPSRKQAVLDDLFRY